MFTSGYFPAYFAGSYFPHGSVTVTDRPSYFPHSEFPVNFYPDPYFPGAPLVVGLPPTSRPSYFSHSLFSVAFYPDQYFPGAPLVIGPPQPPAEVFIGGRFHPRPLQRQVIHALVRLALPQPRIRIRAEYIPPEFAAEVRRLEFDVALNVLAVSAQPADVRAVLQAVAPWVDMEQILADVFQPPRARRSRSAEDVAQEENLLLEHYMLSLKDYQ